MKKAFTLIELLMVISIIAIITTLAVNKVGGVREAAARKVALANQKAVERAVEAYLAGGGPLNWLDSLISGQGDARTPLRHGRAGLDCTHTNFTLEAREIYLGPTRATAAVTATDLAKFREDHNAGLTPGLTSVLCLYTLTAAEAKNLGSRLGLTHVMAHNEYPADPASCYTERTGDGTYVESRSGTDADESGCLAIAVTNGMSLAAINPATEAGRAIYRACGQDLMKTERAGAAYDETRAAAEAEATGGALIALGLGSSASLIGKAQAGLESAPRAAYPVKRYYSRYILLFRLRKVGTAILPEFAGVIDPCGNTLRAAEQIVRAL